MHLANAMLHLYEDRIMNRFYSLFCGKFNNTLVRMNISQDILHILSHC